MPELDPSDLNVSLAALSIYICVFGLISYVAKNKLYLSEALVATMIGIIIGPSVTGWVDPRQWTNEHYSDSGISNPVTLAVTRIAIGIQVLFAGIELPKKYLKVKAKSLLPVLFGFMIPGWFVSGLLIYKIIDGLTYMEALIIAACITPTDPVLANSIAKGRFAEKSVRPEIRNLIIAESGANDGLGYPFVFLPMFWFLAHSAEDFPGTRDLGGVVGRWIYEAWLYEVLLSCIVGALVGYVGQIVLRYCEAKSWLDHDSFLAYGVGMAFLLLGFLGIIGSDDLLACFIAGNAFSWDDHVRIVHEDEKVHDIIDMLLNTAIFIYIGATIPFSDFQNAAINMDAWRLVVLAVCIHLFRRLPWAFAMPWIAPAVDTWRQAVFVGWFGPMGVSAIFYVSIVQKDLPEGRERVKETVEPIVYFLVLSSIIVHGMSIPAHKVIRQMFDQTEKKMFPRLFSMDRRNELAAEHRRAATIRHIGPHEVGAPDHNSDTAAGILAVGAKGGNVPRTDTMGTDRVRFI